MRGRIAAVLLPVLLAGACAEPPPAIPAVAAAVRVETAADRVEFGRGFPLAVVRTWEADREPAPWEDAALAPLVVRPLGVERVTDGRRVRETRRFRAHAFRTGSVAVPALVLELRDGAGGIVRTVRSEPFAITVTPAVDPEAPGAVEPPGGPLRVPARRGGWVLAALIAATGAGAWLVLRSRAPDRGRPAVAAPRPDPRAAGLARMQAGLDGLASSPEAAADDPRPFHAALAAVLRDGLGAVAGCDLGPRTTEEIARDDGPLVALDADVRRRAVDVLARCDVVKFGGAPASPAARAALLDRAGLIVPGEDAA